MSEKPFEKLLIEIGTETGDLSKTIKELEKLQKMGARGGAGFSGIRQSIEDAVTDALRKGGKGGPGGGRGGGPGVAGFDPTGFMERFTQQSNTILKELGNTFGPKRSTSKTQMDVMQMRSMLPAGQMLSNILGSREMEINSETLAKEVIDKKNLDPSVKTNLIAAMKGGMMTHFGRVIAGATKPTTEMESLGNMMMNKDYMQMASVPALRQFMEIFFETTERGMKSDYSSLMRKMGTPVGREIPFIFHKDPKNLDTTGLDPKMVKLLGLESGVMPGTGTLENLKHWGGTQDNISIAPGIDLNPQDIQKWARAPASPERTKVLEWMKANRFGSGMEGTKIFDVASSPESVKNIEDLLEFAGTPAQQEIQRERFQELLKSGKVGQEWKKGHFNFSQMEVEAGKFKKLGLSGGIFVGEEMSSDDVDQMLKRKELEGFVGMTTKSRKMMQTMLKGEKVQEWYKQKGSRFNELLSMKSGETDIDKFTKGQGELVEMVSEILEIVTGTKDEIEESLLNGESEVPTENSVDQ